MCERGSCPLATLLTKTSDIPANHNTLHFQCHELQTLPITALSIGLKPFVFAIPNIYQLIIKNSHFEKRAVMTHNWFHAVWKAKPNSGSKSTLEFKRRYGCQA